MSPSEPMALRCNPAPRLTNTITAIVPITTPNAVSATRPRMRFKFAQTVRSQSQSTWFDSLCH